MSATAPLLETQPFQARTHKFTVQDLNAMAGAGIFDDGERLELFEGDFIEMSPIGNTHVSICNLMAHRLSVACGENAACIMNAPIILSNRTELYPDLIVQRMERTLGGGKATPEDVLLLIEVSETSLKFDLGPKGHSYASAGIREYWVVNLIKPGVHVFGDPDSQAGVYRSERILRGGDWATPSALPSVRIDVSSLLAFCNP